MRPSVQPANICALIIALASFGCSPTSSTRVIYPGQRVEARNMNGWVRIEALSDDKRRFRWSEGDVSLRLRKRTGPWNGGQGLSAQHELFASPVRAEEARLDVMSKEQLNSWMNHEPGLEWVGNRDGYLVGFRAPDDDSPQIELWRCFLHGKPVNFPMKDGKYYVRVVGPAKDRSGGGVR